MYRAKQAGGGQYLLVSSQISSSASEVSELERFMRSALKGEGLELYYQPQYSMVGNLCGLEALLRMNHPQLGSIAADRFLPVAEERGLIVPLGDWVLDEVCRQSMEWQSKKLTPLRISFCVSPLQFLHSDFSARVLSTVTRLRPRPAPARTDRHREHSHAQPPRGRIARCAAWPRWAFTFPWPTSAPVTPA